MSRLGRGHPIKAQYQRGVIGVHTQDAATCTLAFTLSGVDDYTSGTPAFPSCSVVDAFGRADESPIGSPWVSPGVYAGDNAMILSSGQLAKSSGGWSSAFYQDPSGPVGPDVDMFVTVTSVHAADGIELAVQIVNGDTGTPDFYMVHINGGAGSWRFYKSELGSQTALGSPVTPGTAIAAGNKIGVRYLDGVLSAYLWTSGSGVWTEIVTVADATFDTVQGYTGILTDAITNT